MTRKLAVIGIGNMAKAIIAGIVNSDITVSEIIVYDSNPEQYKDLPTDSFNFTFAPDAETAVSMSDCVLIAVKPQNYPEVLQKISKASGYEKKLYISIGAGITVKSISEKLQTSSVVRVLPNVPMIIGKGVSVICKNNDVSQSDFEFVCSVFRCAGSNVLIEETEMNRMIGVTSSSPAYVFKFINAIYQGALAQGLDGKEILRAVCDMVIGSAELLKSSDDTPEALIKKVASKGGTTEQALLKLDENNFDDIIREAMIACTARADELGAIKNK